MFCRSTDLLPLGSGRIWSSQVLASISSVPASEHTLCGPRVAHLCGSWVWTGAVARLPFWRRNQHKNISHREFIWLWVLLVQTPVHSWPTKTENWHLVPVNLQPKCFPQGRGQVHSFGSHSTVVCLFHDFEEWQLERVKERGSSSHSTSRAKGVTKDQPAHPRPAWPKLLGCRAPATSPAGRFSLRVSRGR